jgi:plasmid stabilization system protein ParE
MDYRVIFKETFLADLEEIVRSVAVNNPSAARKLGDMIIQSSESLCFFPERHPRIRQRPGSQAVYRKEILQGVLAGAT